MRRFLVPIVASALAAVPPAFAVDFVKDVYPIFQKRCFDCHIDQAKHPKGKKPKGELRLDTPEMILKGGEEGKVLIAGDPEKSILYKLISLPEDDDDIMPPKGDALSKEQQQAIYNWIKEGGKMEGWKPEMAKALDGGKAEPKKLELVDQLAKGLSPLDAKATAPVSKLGGLVMPLANNNSLIQVNLSLTGEEIGDAQVAQLTPLKSHLTWLNLAGTKVSDDGLKSLSGLKNLTRLHLEKTAVSDAGIQHLSGLDNLEYLNLYGTKVTNAGLNELAKMKSLKKLYLWQTGADKAGVDALKKSHPALYVNIGWEKPPVVEQKKEDAKKPEATKAEPANKNPAEVKFADLAKLFDKGSCCFKAHAGGKDCGHGCCKEALAKGKVCLKCNPGAKGKQKS
jgi:mono/diheme cytochrome c family protein